MLGRDGALSLYWDLDNGAYTDLAADRTGQLSFFARDASGQEAFEADLSPKVLTTQWYWSRIGQLAMPSVLHAA